MTQEEYDAIARMTYEEIDAFKNGPKEDSDDSTIEELEIRLKREEIRIISLMKRIVYDVSIYKDYQPLEEFIAALQGSKYLKDDEYKNYIREEGKKHLGEGYEYIQFLKVVEKYFEEDYDDGEI